jgi:hypothetical protein
MAYGTPFRMRQLLGGTQRTENSLWAFVFQNENGACNLQKEKPRCGESGALQQRVCLCAGALMRG